MSPTSNAPILVGVDGSEVALAAVRWAATDAARRRAPLHLVYLTGVLGDYGSGIELGRSDAGSFRWGGLDAIEIAYATAVAEAAPLSDIDITAELTDAPPVPVLRRRSGNARLLVVGAHQVGAFGRALLGALSTALARRASCPVAVVPDAIEYGAGPVVVGVDGSPSSVSAVEVAFDEAAIRGADLVAVHTFSDSQGHGSAVEMRQTGEELLDRMLARYGNAYPELTVRRVVVEDRPARRLLEVGDKAQLILVGSCAHDDCAATPLGSVTRAVLHEAQVPVIVTRSAS
ncbi:universal stress protein [Nocardia abscessus]|uniref:universal stress protein n=1 Tax=Nocardia abscessus TaxID=120957 RepID=UPI0018952F3A|nr:universal stress protein [Nocardia abscessus]MBF6223398.1 universal stress protein [Nocardia abscessus]